MNNDVDAGEGVVGHDYRVGDHGSHVEFFGALGSVAHGEDELRADEEDAGVAEDDEDYFTDAVAEGIDGGVGEGAGDEVEG